MVHRRRAAGIDDLDGRIGRHRRPFGHGLEPLLHLIVIALIRAPQHEPRRGALRNDVRGGAPLGDDAVHPRISPQLLAPQPHRAEQQHERVEGVLALPRVRRGVGLEPGEGHRHVLGRERRTLDVRPVTRVIEERSVDAFEQTIVDHDLLARATLFGRCAQEDDLAGKRIPDRGQPDRRADPRCSHRVVTAAVAKPRQGVIFGKHRDPRPLRSAAARKASPDRRREAAHRVLDVIAMAPDRGGDPGRNQLAHSALGSRGVGGSGAVAAERISGERFRVQRAAPLTVTLHPGRCVEHAAPPRQWSQAWQRASSQPAWTRIHRRRRGALLPLRLRESENACRMGWRGRTGYVGAREYAAARETAEA